MVLCELCQPGTAALCVDAAKQCGTLLTNKRAVSGKVRQEFEGKALLIEAHIAALTGN